MFQRPLTFLLSYVLLCTTAQSQDLSLESDSIDEIIVIGRQEFLETQFTAERTASHADSAKLMNQVPGGSANNNGPLSGQIQYRGMFGPRINVRVDGMLIHGGGPNWMAPPLAHIPAALMDVMVVEQGIPSIATGGGIGGAVTAYWKKPDYTHDENWTLSGDVEAAYSSVDQGNSFAAVLGLSSEHQRLFLLANLDQGNDYEFANGEVNATDYQRKTAGIGYGVTIGKHQFELDYRSLDTDDTGTPSLPLDIEWFYTDIWNTHYSTDFDNVSVSLRVYGSDIDHKMNNSDLRQAPDFSSLMLPPFTGDDKRTVRTNSEELGYDLSFNLATEHGAWVFGLEGKQATHDATVFDPDFAPFFVENFNDSESDQIAAFGQWSTTLNDAWFLEAGLRYERVKTNTDDVDAFPARLVDTNPAMWPMGTPPRAVWLLREQFNNSDRSKTDNNTDWVLKSRYQLAESLVVELGLAQKSRSPSYQERYLWIPLEANAGIGDGNNYVGNPDLNSEVSQQLEIGFDWSPGNFYFSPRLFYRTVDDYIQGIAATSPAVIGVSANANGDPTPLSFANVDATLFGVDASFGLELVENLSLDGTASYVRGERDDINDNLYRIAPTTLRLFLTWTTDNVESKVEQYWVAKQDKLSSTNTLDPTNVNNSFQSTPGYGITNLLVRYLGLPNTTLSFGVENIFDKNYTDHLTGFNRVIDSNVPVGDRLSGPGRNVFLRARYQF